MRTSLTAFASLATIANAQLVIETNFDDPSPWQNLGIGNVALTGTGPQSTGGNSGPHYQIASSVPATVPLGGSGLISRDSFDLSAFAAGSITVTTDYRFDPSPLRTEPGLGIAFFQNSRIYLPRDQFASPGTSDQWTTLAPATWNLADLSHSSGIPLDLSLPVRIGFVGVLEPTGQSLQTSFDIDNLRIEIVPAPATAAILLPALALTRRRR